MKFIKKILGMNVNNIAGKILDTGESVIKTLSSKEQGTRRQKSDMLSDSWLSKNIRPLIALWVLMLFTLYLISKTCGVALDRETGSDIFYMAIIIFTFYFPGRTLEKWMKEKRRK